MTTRNSARRARAALIASLLLAGLASPPSFAESACKGLEKGPCSAKDACHWVDGYTRKDGVKVASHCRKTPSRKSSSSQSSKSSTTDKNAD
ncbi:hypothetical protein [Thiocystis violacea]|uniref:hypothetical protein n=1 Tax=Thiocystis violacea TaxID=13725 RepID=UPI0019079925|nr:hypothetical protein [Thiocystis violacea]